MLRSLVGSEMCIRDRSREVLNVLLLPVPAETILNLHLVQAPQQQEAAPAEGASPRTRPAPPVHLPSLLLGTAAAPTRQEVGEAVGSLMRSLSADYCHDISYTLCVEAQPSKKHEQTELGNRRRAGGMGWEYAPQIKPGSLLDECTDEELEKLVAGKLVLLATLSDEAVDLYAVSYTHLTLPTKRIV
eukprot:TRINITY_DN10314_c0_g1_i3.p1 TRINITY_DN10314_c0_g1~~TRINITY_DN10314_c0_g1_i3.p1  ORF type:complete len:187 (+),score=54.62 TRINITY_DN10314_c0_g1_i3:85-645(+)